MLAFSIKKERKPDRRGDTRAFALDVAGKAPAGACLGISGPSGSGKSTLLRCIAGLERPDSGTIANGGRIWFDSASGVDVPTRKRDIGMVFQGFALFPDMTALGNILFANPDRERARALLDLVRMEGHASHYPHELSGGQRQRVAIARAIARSPALLLLDEPLSSLDEELRDDLGDEIGRIRKSTGITTVLVSHSRREIARLCDCSIELREGGIRD